MQRTPERERRTQSDAELLADELLALIGYLLKSGQDDVLDIVADLELSISQMRALCVLERADQELAMHQLAEEIGLPVGTTGRAVDVLVRNGLAIRGEDPYDRRVKRVSISEQGQQTMLRLAAARRKGLRAFVTSLDADQQHSFRRALAPIVERPEIRALMEDSEHD